MRKIFPILLLFCLCFLFSASSEEMEIVSEVIGVNPEFDFFIIRAGEDEGVEVGDGLIVHRDGEKIGEAYIREVRQNVSGAEILNVQEGEEIHEYDKILIVKDKEIKRPPKEKMQREVPKKPKESKWTPISAKAEGTKISADIPNKETQKIIQKPKPQWTTLIGTAASVPTKPKLTMDVVSGEGYRDMSSSLDIEGNELISINIDRERNTVFVYTELVLRENGFSIISSNRATGTIQATKPIELSIIKELWADAMASIDHKIVLSLEIKGSGRPSILTISSFKEYYQKEKHIKSAITEDSKYYDELIMLASKIKQRSEVEKDKI